ncbi:MAG: DUF2341 domain-containing protein [Candidatus Doudnabacteria bacterium]|nr:DUF2341 domain-containing protein [Candidatus Doudnabacteria bacterium]
MADLESSPPATQTPNEIFIPENILSADNSNSLGYWRNLQASINTPPASGPIGNLDKGNSTYLDFSGAMEATGSAQVFPEVPILSSSTPMSAPESSQTATGTGIDLPIPDLPSEVGATDSTSTILIQSDDILMATGTESASGTDVLPDPLSITTVAEPVSPATSTTDASDISKVQNPEASSSSDAVLTPQDTGQTPSSTIAVASDTPEVGGSPSEITGGFDDTGTKSAVIAAPKFSPELQYSSFAPTPTNDPGASTTSLVNAKLSVVVSGPANPGAYLTVQYAVASSSWQDLGTIKFDSSYSEINNKKIYFLLPDNSVRDVGKLVIKFVYFGAPYTNKPAVFLNSLAVSGQYVKFSSDQMDAPDWSLKNATSTFSHLDLQNKLLDLNLPDNLSNPITIGRKGQDPFGMVIRNVNSQSVPILSGNEITYPDAFSSTDLQYQLRDSGLKENIILKDLNHPRSFKYLVDSQSYDVIQTAPNAIQFYKKGQKGNPLFRLFALTAPVMTDANGRTSNGLIFNLKRSALTLTPDAKWLKAAQYPVIIDPSVDISVLNVSSFPVAGGYWTIDFTTIGAADLNVTPADLDTQTDMKFASLTCDGSPAASSVGTGGAVFSANWSCPDGMGEIKFLDLKTGHHHMIFNFGGATQDAYNGANVWTGGGGDGNWETNANWSTGAKPTATDDVVINTATTVNINGGTTVNSLTLGISGGGTASVLNFNYNAVDLVSPLVTTGDLTVYGTAKITHTAGTASVGGKINMQVGGNANITGAINADGKGFGSNQGPGAGVNDGGNGGGGGAYGGMGGLGRAGAGSAATYGSLTTPTDLGSGGGLSYGSGTPGGGSIQLSVSGSVTINGSVSANGAGPDGASGGGSGGSVYITANTLIGTGSISSVGGNSYAGNGVGGGGGGGRIAVYYTIDSSSITYTAAGGISTSSGAPYTGGAGTIYKKSAAETGGDLLINNNNEGGTMASGYGQTSLGSFNLDSLTITNMANVYLTATSATTTALIINNHALYDARASTTLAYGSLSWSGAALTDSGGNFAVLAQNQDLTVPSGSMLIENIPGGAVQSYNNVTIDGTLTHTGNINATTGTVSLYKINWVVGNLIVDSGGTINVDGKGFNGNQGPGKGTAGNGAGGASYGGLGANGSTGAAAGTAYGSLTVPTDIGSGGGTGNSSGGVGGGAVEIAASGTTTINGNISANGTQLSGSDGGGSGGSIYLTTNTLSGTSSLSAIGGNSLSGNGIGGGGGGGRIAVYYTTDNSTVSYSAAGGTNSYGGPAYYGTPGTVFKKNPGQSFGDLIIDDNNIGGSDETKFPLTPIGAYTFDNITLQNSGAIFLSASSATTTILTLSNNGYYNAKAGTRLNYTLLNLPGAGIIGDSGGTMPLLDQNQDLTIPANLKLVMQDPGASRTYNNVTISGILTHAFNSLATTSTPASSLYKINYAVNGNLTINSGGSVNVDGRGYGMNNGPGVGANGSGAGASYGGLGGASTGHSTTTIGSIYGSSTAPTDLGSGSTSGALNDGAAGGGVVEFTVTGNTTINGTISANGLAPVGNDGQPPGGASGGSIYLTTNDLSGTGSLSAIGGNSYTSGCCNITGGGGGGGRIAVSLTSNLDNAVVRSVLGGLQANAEVGGTGTLVPVDQPTVTTQDPTSIADTSVTGHGTITSIAFYPVLHYGNVIAQTSNPTLATSISTFDLGTTGTTGAFTARPMTGLTHDTNYHTAAYATTLGGTVYGNDVAFLTDAPAILTQQDFRVYQNNGQLQPAIAIASQNAPASIYTTSTPIRLVMNVGASTDFLPAGVGVFKLQVSTSTNANWIDVGGRGGGWWNTDWAYRRKITFNNASSTSDLTNFPVLVSLNAVSFGNIDYSKTKSAGADIRFLSADNSTVLPYEIEKWDNTATSTIWVKVPVLHASSTSDSIYMYYDDPAANSAATTTGVWDGNFQGVWHMDEGSGSVLDSTYNQRTAAVTGSPTYSVQGEFGPAVTFASGQLFTASDSGFPTSNSDGSMSVWIKSSSNSSYPTFIAYGTHAPSNDSRGITENGGHMWPGWNGSDYDSGFAINDNKWHLVEWVNSGGAWHTYVDGKAGATSIHTAATTLQDARFGDVPNGTTDWIGSLQEVRFSNVARSADWVLAEYKTESGNFNTYASEEAMAVITTPASWNFYSNPGIASGTTVSSLLLSTSNVQETYEQNNPTAMNPNQVSVGQNGEWDFSIIPTNAAVNNTYFFRMVHSDGTLLDAYSTLPSVSLLPDNPPDNPSSLGPAGFTGGSYSSSTKPTLTFALSDPDAIDTVSYDFQISTSSSFSGLVVDYSSALQAQGAASFTVGQPAGGGAYNIGSAGQSLSDSDSGYYWRVLAIDAHSVQSGYTVANSGGMAFKIDSSPPVPGTLTITSVTDSGVTVNISGSSDPGSGLAAAPYIFTNSTLSNSSSATDSTSSIFSALAPGTLYSFYATVTDALGNNTTTISVSTTTLGTLPTPTPSSSPSAGGGGGGSVVAPPSPSESAGSSSLTLAVPPSEPGDNNQSTPSPVTGTKNSSANNSQSGAGGQNGGSGSGGGGSIVPGSPANVLPNGLFSGLSPAVDGAVIFTAALNVVRAAIAKLPNGAGSFSIALAGGFTALGAESILINQGLLWNAVSTADITYGWLRFWYGLLAVLGLRKKRRRWGTVYDSNSKQPLDPVIVELVEVNTKKVIEQSISDINGQFGFLDRVGKFLISAKKTNYRFPSQNITGQTDLIYENLYHGEEIVIKRETAVLTPNIPMDPMAFDWNQQDKLRIVKFMPRLEMALKLVFGFIFWSGALYTLIALTQNHTWLNLALAILYAAIIAAKILLPDPRLWGQVKSGFRDVGNLLLELSPEKIPGITLAKAKSAPDGRFFLKAPPGNYLLKVTDKLSRTVIYTKNITIAEDGLFNKTLRL